MLFAGRRMQVPVGFKTRWTVSGDATARTVTLPLSTGHGETYNCTVDWGDGSPLSTIIAFNDAARIHTYAADGTYDIDIRGTMKGWSFANAGDKLKITKVLNWGDPSLFTGFSYFAFGFQGCSNLISLPASGSIIPNGTALTSIRAAFNATGITSIAESTLALAVNLTECRDAFSSSQLASIPPLLFKYNVAITSFQSTFQGTQITSIPSGLHDTNTALTNVNGEFQLCSKLTISPSGLYRLNTLVTNFSFAMASCPKLQIPADLFFNAGEEATRFLNQSVNFNGTFNRTSFTGIQGTAPDLWGCNFGTGTPTTGICFGGAGNSATSLTNYASIPSTWTT